MRYLQDYASELGINVQYNTEIREIDKEDGRFMLKDQTGKVHFCSVLIVRLEFHVVSSSFLVLSFTCCKSWSESLWLLYAFHSCLTAWLEQ